MHFASKHVRQGVVSYRPICFYFHIQIGFDLSEPKSNNK